MEIGRRPLPHVPDHLTAAPGAVSVGEGADVEGAARAALEVRARGGRRLVSPREPAGAPPPVPRGRALPLPPPGPAPARPPPPRPRFLPPPPPDPTGGGP